MGPLAHPTLQTATIPPPLFQFVFLPVNGTTADLTLNKPG